MYKRIGLTALVLIAGIALLPASAAADSKHDAVHCENFDGHEDSVAVISFSDASNGELWHDAREFADASLEECDLQGREETELAGEVRAHALGEHAPGDINPGPTIDMVGYGNDPQEDKYEWLMGGYIPPWIPVPGAPSSSK